MTSKSHHGFTLVELAVALMVIGLLIGGVLKGLEMISNAKITSAMQQIKSYDTAAITFRDTYGFYPGDIKNPGNVIPKCTTDTCNLGGDGNGYVGISSGYASQWLVARREQFNFFPHLTIAGMINGPTGGTTEEKEATPPSGFWQDNELFFPTFLETTLVVGRRPFYVIGDPEFHIYQAFGVPGKFAAALDMKMDDGFANRGDILGSESDLGICNSIPDADGNAEYDHENLEFCEIHIKAGF